MATDKLIVIVGETASGKSDLAIELAEQVGGEIICADSRTIYKGMDIGTAKPTQKDQNRVPHHLLDVVEPGQAYSVAQFKKVVLKLIPKIVQRGKVPIMVGGSGLYIDAVIFDYQFRPVDVGKRNQLATLSLKDLQSQARRLGVKETEVNFKNKRHLQRAIETGGVLKQTQQMRPNTLVIGLTPDRELLKARIKERVDIMIERGLVGEVEKLGKKYGWENEAMSGIGYRFFAQYVRGEINLDEAKAKFVQGDLSLAKRQRTWFKRNKNIHWLSEPKQAFSLVKTFLGATE